MLHSGTFVKTILPADANNIITLFDFNQILSSWKQYEADYIVTHSIVLEDFQCKIFLPSLLEAPWIESNVLASDASKQAALDKSKKEGQKVYLEVLHAYGNGPWQSKGEEILQNKNSLELPWALMSPFFSTNRTALLDANLKVGVRIVSKAQGIGGIKGNDYIKLFGTWYSDSNREKKKDDGIEALTARMAALEVLLEGMFSNLPANSLVGRGGTAGAASVISASNFATPAQITQAINALVGQSNTALNTLEELGVALANDANFAATVTNNLATKLTKTANLDDLANKQVALNTLVGAATAGMLLAGDGANLTLRKLALNSVNSVPSDVTGILQPANGGTGLSATHRFRAAANQPQTLPNSAANNHIPTKIIMNQEVLDSNNQYDPSLSRLTAIGNEIWEISVYITFYLTAPTRLALYVYRNGLEVPATSRLFDFPYTFTGNNFFALRVPILEFTLAPNEFLEIFAYTSPGCTTSADTGLASVFWSGKRIA